MPHLTLIDFACNGGWGGWQRHYNDPVFQSSLAYNVAVNKGTGDAGTIEIEVFLLGSQETRTIRRKKDRRREKVKKK